MSTATTTSTTTSTPSMDRTSSRFVILKEVDEDQPTWRFREISGKEIQMRENKIQPSDGSSEREPYYVVADGVAFHRP
jgi:hypothetical protein